MTIKPRELRQWEVDYEDCKWRWEFKTPEEQAAMIKDIFLVAWEAGNSAYVDSGVIKL